MFNAMQNDDFSALSDNKRKRDEIEPISPNILLHNNVILANNNTIKINTKDNKLKCEGNSEEQKNGTKAKPTKQSELTEKVVRALARIKEKQKQVVSKSDEMCQTETFAGEKIKVVEDKTNMH
jgi:hypothetical protein